MFLFLNRTNTVSRVVWGLFRIRFPLDPFPRITTSVPRHYSIQSNNRQFVCWKPLFASLRPSLLNREQTSFYLENWFCPRRSFTNGTLSLVISPDGKPKFETSAIEPPKKEKWKTKKRLKLQRKKEKQKRKAANKNDPRRLGVKGKKTKQRFANAEERIKFKLERAKIKEAMLIERLKAYEVPKAQGPIVEPHVLTGEERHYMKKMAQKSSNYVPVGRRGVFGGVILNMHLHWKKHETVKVICKPCKPGQLQEYACEIARLSGGVPIQAIGDDTLVFYRGRNYVQPRVMSPVDTLSKKKALEKSKYEQSLDSVRRFIAIAEKELELYYRHVALYGDPNDRHSKSILTNGSRKCGSMENGMLSTPCTERDLKATDDFSIEYRGSESCLDEESDDDDIFGEECLHSHQTSDDDDV